MDFDSALKRIHWAMVVPSIVLILFSPYGTYILCRQVEKYDAIEKNRTLIQSAAVILCLLIGKKILNKGDNFFVKMIKKFIFIHMI